MSLKELYDNYNMKFKLVILRYDEIESISYHSRIHSIYFKDYKNITTKDLEKTSP